MYDTLNAILNNSENATLQYFIFGRNVLSDFINLTQVHNFTVSAQDILPSVDFRYLP